MLRIILTTLRYYFYDTRKCDARMANALAYRGDDEKSFDFGGRTA
jgi:hypothetical protein